jgi:hypothetical protein
MSDTRFLITGATGATGSAAAALLLDRGERVRAFVHREGPVRSSPQAGGGGCCRRSAGFRCGAGSPQRREPRLLRLPDPAGPGSSDRSVRPVGARGRRRGDREHVADLSAGRRQEPFGPRALAGGTGFRLVRAQRCTRPAYLFRGMAALPSPDDPPGRHVRTVHDRPARTHRR